jgi:transposase-like protein
MKEKKGTRSDFRIFSKDDRKKIVALIDQSELTRQQAMQQYGIVDPETLRSWILRYSTDPENVLGKIFTKAEKRQAAYRVITGEVSTSQLAVELSVDPSSLRRWVRDVRAEIGLSKSSKGIAPPSSNEITSHYQTMDDLRLKIAALETMIDIAEKELNIDIRKKSGTKQ